MVMENNELVKETVETGMNIVTEVAKSNGGLKRFGMATGYVVVGAVAYKGVEMLIDFAKSKLKKRKDKTNQPEVADEKTEMTESVEK
jgi:hypothetical protein